MARRGENIYRRKDGRWEARYNKGRKGGKIKYGYVFASTYKEVKEKMEIAQSKLPEQLRKEMMYKGTLPGDRFAKIANEWMTERKPQWKRSSIVRYTNMLNLYILPKFSKKKICEITRDEVMDFSNQLLESGGKKGMGLAPKTVSSIISVIKNVFEYAARVKGYPVSDIRGIYVKQSQRAMRILSLAEQENLSSYLRENLTPCNLGILICMYTGLRIGEICALKWEDISFEGQYLYVHQTMQRLQTMEKGETKTTVLISDPKSDCSIRAVPIPDEIFQILKKEKKESCAFLLTGQEHVYMEPRTMQNRFKAVTKHCRLGNVNFHVLRHTFATRCVELGFDVKSLSEILGHSNVNITLNRYVHPSMELKQKNMNMLSNLFAVK